MTSTSLSHLNQLLKEFHLSGKQLAEYLNVDYSLVSKWRSEKRRLNPEYISKIAELFLTLDAKYEYKRIEKMIHHTFSEKEKAHGEKMQALLEFWLSSKSPEKEANSIENFMKKKCTKQSYYVFNGTSGRRESINIFLDYMCTRQGGNLWLYSQEDNKWYYEDDDFLKTWQEKNITVLNQGNTIHVIHPVELRYSRVAHFLYRWIPLHLIGNAFAYYIPIYRESDIKVTIFLAENELVLVGVTSEKFTKKIITYMFTEQEVLQNARDVLMELFHQSDKMFERFSFESNGQFFNAFKQIIANKRPVYYFSGAPIMYMVPSDCLLEALMENEYTEEEKKLYERIIYQCSFDYMMTISKVPINYIINEGQLRRLLKMNRVMMRFLSHCLGRPFYVNQKTFRKLLIKSMEVVCGYEDMSIMLTDHSMFHPFNDIAMFVKEKEVAGLVGTHYESSEGACALITYEDSVVKSLYGGCVSYMESCPARKMSKEEVRDKIYELIEESPVKVDLDSPAD